MVTSIGADQFPIVIGTYVRREQDKKYKKPTPLAVEARRERERKKGGFRWEKERKK